jgi:hypothetical protein
MNNYKISYNCHIQINRNIDDAPIIIFEDVPTQNIFVNNNSVGLNTDLENNIIQEIANTIKAEPIKYIKCPACNNDNTGRYMCETCCGKGKIVDV